LTAFRGQRTGDAVAEFQLDGTPAILAMMAGRGGSGIRYSFGPALPIDWLEAGTQTEGQIPDWR
jgi:hypothetical protein